MSYENKDIRLVDGTVGEVSEAFKSCLENASFKVIDDDTTGTTADTVDITAHNLQRSALRLYLSASPQIVRLHLEQESDERVKVEITYGLFNRFRLFYYSVLCGLLTLFLVLYGLSTIDESVASSEVFMHSLTLAFTGAGCLILAVIFMCRVLDTGPCENFIEKLFKGFSGVVVLKTGSGFPDLWRAVSVLAAFLLIFFLSTDFLTTVPQMIGSGYLFLGGVVVILAILVLLLLVMSSKSVAITRVLFCLLGIALCLPLAILGNAPAANFLVSDVVKQVEIIANNYEKRVDEVTINAKASKVLTAKLERTKLAGLVIVTCFYSGIVLIVLFLLWNALRLPVIITRQHQKFLTKNPDSLYNQALHPDKRSLLFDSTVSSLWLVMSIANLAGLYFSLFVFERVVFGANRLLGTELGLLFFDNTRTVVAHLLNSSLQSTSVSFVHTTVMLLYSLPLTLLFLFVLLKNIRSLLNSFNLLKPSREFGEIEKELLLMTTEICKSIGLQVPAIRVIGSPLIEARTEYLAFSFFKNIMFVSVGTWKKLKDNEGALYGLLAHEVWHQKKHTLKRRILNTFSDYTLFGNGFLALLQNSYLVEQEADAFSRDWLTKKLKSKELATKIFSSLLQLQRSYNSSMKFKQSSVSGAFRFSDIKDNRKKLLASYDASSKIGRVWISCCLLYDSYFGERIESYFHPSVEERTRWLEE